MALQTAASKYVQQILTDRWALEFGGETGPCRYINGGSCFHPNEPGSSYSQHSWGNALDVYPLGHKHMTKEMIQARLSLVWDFLQANKTKLGIRVDLNWDDNDAHWNHIHIDFWPTGYGTPACCPGKVTNAWRNKNGRTFTLPGAISPVMEAEGIISDPNAIPLMRGDNSELVRHYQNRMLVWDSEALPGYGADGDFGNEMEDWVKIFEGRWGLSRSGIIDQTLADLLDGRPVVVPPPVVQPPPVVVPPPVVSPPVVAPVPPPVPLPEYDTGFEGAYRKFFYPLKGKTDEAAERSNQAALEDYLNKQGDYTQSQIDEIVVYLEGLSAVTKQLGISGGVPGPQGEEGMRGPKGVQGFPGSPGQRGFTGQTGLRGHRGSVWGITDVMPPTHAPADGWKPGDVVVHTTDGELFHFDGTRWSDDGVALTGPQGPRGLSGHKGDKGDPGEHGTHGDPGEHGTHGDPGIQGQPGPAGVEGHIGPAGHSIHILSTVATPADLPTGLTADHDGDAHLVKSTGDLMIWNNHDQTWHDLGHVAGPAGPRGEKGDEGIHGEHGIPGTPGLAGAKGDTGEIGHDGPAGVEGHEGTHGADGSIGPQGHDGPQGHIGPQGIIGDIGPRGAEGQGYHLKGVKDTKTTIDHIPNPAYGDLWLALDTKHMWIWDDPCALDPAAAAAAVAAAAAAQPTLPPNELTGGDATPNAASHGTWSEERYGDTTTYHPYQDHMAIMGHGAAEGTTLVAGPFPVVGQRTPYLFSLRIKKVLPEHVKLVMMWDHGAHTGQTVTHVDVGHLYNEFTVRGAAPPMARSVTLVAEIRDSAASQAWYYFGWAVLRKDTGLSHQAATVTSCPAWHDVGMLQESAGPTGPQGPRGLPGADSTVAGPRGATGARGAPGAKGTTGSRGATGAASRVPGPKGSTGSRGLTGARGPAGPAVSHAHPYLPIAGGTLTGATYLGRFQVRNIWFTTATPTHPRQGDIWMH